LVKVSDRLAKDSCCSVEDYFVKKWWLSDLKKWFLGGKDGFGKVLHD
jgi:hypothetical protein